MAKKNDDLIDKVMYSAVYWTFAGIGWCLRYTFDVIVYFITMGYYRHKYNKEHPPLTGFTMAQRFEHTHIVAGTGHGKTQLLQTMILDHLEWLHAGSGSLIVIDSQGDLFRNILSLAEINSA